MIIVQIDKITGSPMEKKKTYTISEKINPDKLNFHRRKQSLGMHVPSIHGSRSNTESIYLAVSPPEKHPQL